MYVIIFSMQSEVSQGDLRENMCKISVKLNHKVLRKQQLQNRKWVANLELPSWHLQISCQIQNEQTVDKEGPLWACVRVFNGCGGWRGAWWVHVRLDISHHYHDETRTGARAPTAAAGSFIDFDTHTGTQTLSHKAKRRDQGEQKKTDMY